MFFAVLFIRRKEGSWEGRTDGRTVSPGNGIPPPLKIDAVRLSLNTDGVHNRSLIEVRSSTYNVANYFSKRSETIVHNP